MPVWDMPLDVAAVLSMFLIDTSIMMQRLSSGIQSCGGPIDVLTVTADAGVQWVQRKPALPSAAPTATWLPIRWTQPAVSIVTSGDTRRASSYSASTGSSARPRSLTHTGRWSKTPPRFG
jgi:hypothetical protein